ncbi:hypothetical protein OMR58_04510 [Erwinia sp. INIA-01]|uniref:hypothetical protein n=1 Tax=Erwinia sp. INIA01 TaxID=2991500 RepID=UPI0022251264|nr:hypothetical protein [Erwinia sp. INIA01]MCW1873705.1 hypothetical protein [Erwinia sp. INIA01]
MKIDQILMQIVFFALKNVAKTVCYLIPASPPCGFLKGMIHPFDFSGTLGKIAMTGLFNETLSVTSALTARYCLR